MIAATPTSWTQGEYDLTDPSGSGAPFGEISLRLFGGARLSVGGADFEVEAAHWTKTTYLVTLDGHDVAVAERPAFWRSRYAVRFDARALGLPADLTLDLATDGWRARGWTLAADGVPAGRADWARGRRPRLMAGFSDDVPLVAQAVLVAVVVSERRRRRSHTS